MRCGAVRGKTKNNNKPTRKNRATNDFVAALLAAYDILWTRRISPAAGRDIAATPQIARKINRANTLFGRTRSPAVGAMQEFLMEEAIVPPRGWGEGRKEGGKGNQTATPSYGNISQKYSTWSLAEYAGMVSSPSRCSQRLRCPDGEMANPHRDQQQGSRPRAQAMLCGGDSLFTTCSTLGGGASTTVLLIVLPSSRSPHGGPGTTSERLESIAAPQILL